MASPRQRKKRCAFCAGSVGASYFRAEVFTHEGLTEGRYVHEECVDVFMATAWLRRDRVDSTIASSYLRRKRLRWTP